ncbi:MAG TPA: sigma-70 family RNA polymerase sigma factor [Terriglobales bacterium]|nr:sigma-70 family RNA polymerase sigma factor [Terriglobales bacterium]HET7871750.1 sigma-70 family RNA polymerase sigma factor [Terriglobales bacterium]
MRTDLKNAIAELRKGDSDAMERALASLQQTAFAFSMKVCGHREDAEDTAQETLIRAMPELAHFDSPEALAVWLYKVARSHCLMRRRRSKFAGKQDLSLEELMPDRAELEALTASRQSGPEQQLLREESREELQRAVLKVPPDYRMVLVLHDMEELSTEEVAQVTGLRPGTVRVRLHRARIFLRNELALKGKPIVTRRKAQPSARCKRLFAMLSDYLDQEIDPSLCDSVDGHLGDCPPCKAYLASLEETVRRCRRHCTEELKTEVRARVRELIRESALAKAAR